MTAPQRRILLSSVSSDAHTWNLAYLQLFLAESGHRVDNLGACVPDWLLVSRAIATKPHVIVISTVNGHGYADGLRLIGAVRAEAVLREIPVAIGGKLGVSGLLTAEHERNLLDAGFDAVFAHDANLIDFLAFVDMAPAADIAAEHHA